MTIQIDDVLEIMPDQLKSFESWKGNCYAIATAIVEDGLIEGKAEYGVWEGPIAEGSYFYGKLISRHGWIRLPDGQICDPTRWVFENVAPYIYVGPDDYYDMGAARLREQFGYEPASENLVLDFLDDPELFADNRKLLHRLGNTPPQAYPFLMAEVYEALDRMGFSVLIPIDYQTWAGIK